ncbi:TPA: phage antirepressor KilAC domain-containing protein [Streptococcus suis]|uniref:BRO family protein n=1 Tax=Streptococcus suis TaxID=1307 RepID=A0AAJ2PGD3_STRSU|nr:BRO family protein [Streptococcus suis]HEL1749295.1 phage antirepressor KilAC domain-containing protein [Streptococcus suis]HEL2303709.1 phage antirepressor KilAC domain-containing protein [Streptococcus suis]HEL2320025.1 phage antirepressor KilAC domain-containing protein [Streptococcus suis]HEL2325084.1 phage antirepressor KilAC domain-containing protein [Streptococcus suis]
MELQIFKNEQFGEVRTADIKGEVYFNLKDCCKILEIKNHKDTVKRLNQHGVVTTDLIDSLGRTQQANFINESNFYKLVFQSRKPEAEKFADWVTSEVLPAIRKHGGYLTDNKLEEALLNPDTLISLATQLKEEREARKQLQVANSQLMVDNQIMQPKAQYFDDLVARNLLTSFRDTAKMLKIKEREFINWLLDKKFLYRDKKGKLVPFANKNDGLFEIKETKNESTAWKGTQTLVTPKGRETFNILLRV